MDLAKKTQHQFNVASVAILILAPRAQKNRLCMLNRFAELEDDLAQEYNALMDQPKVTETVLSPITVVALYYYKRDNYNQAKPGE
jgi:hypothetical protein